MFSSHVTGNKEDEPGRLVVGQANQGKGLRPIRIIPPIAGFLLTLLCFWFTYSFLTEGSFLRRLLLPAGVWHQSPVQFAILWLFFWSLVDLLDKTRGIAKEKRAFNNKALIHVHDFVQQHDIGSTLNMLLQVDKKTKRGKIFQRVYSLLKHLGSRQDPARSHEYIRHKLELDADTATSGYTAVRIFVWAMPILGFIGTVMGIGLAVGNFSGFLSGEIEDISLVKNQLANVASGLSFAFDTTLLGLGTSLITMLCSTFVQNREEAFLTKIDELCLNIISSFDRERGRVSEGRVDNGLAETVEATREVVGLLKEEVSQFVSVSHQLNRGFSQLSYDTTNMVDGIQSYQEETARFKETLSVNLGAFSTMTERLSEELAKVPLNVEKSGKSLIEGVNGHLEKVNHDLRTICESNKENLTKLIENYSAYLEPLKLTVEAKNAVMTSLKSVTHILKRMEVVQSQLVPLLENLSKPFEFRLTPVESKGGVIDDSES